MRIQAAAPSKVLFSGEHSVVYGKPALVAANNLRLRVTIFSGTPQNTNPKLWEQIHIVDTIVKEHLKKHEIEYSDKPYDLEITSDIPVGRGMGSSASFSVATVAAIYTFLTTKEPSQETVNNLAYRMEKHFHGNASGVDVSAASFGGLIFFRKEFEFLKQISALNFKLPEKFIQGLYLIDSGKPAESSKEIITAVGRFYNQETKIAEDLMNQLEKVTKRMVVSIVKEDQNFFHEAIVDNQSILNKLGVVSDSTSKLLNDLKPYGVGKVTGAGGKQTGSGYLLFSATDVDGLEKFLSNEKIRVIKFKQDYEGLQIRIQT